MTATRTGALIASVVLLASLTAGCGDGETVLAGITEAPGGQPGPAAEWLTEAELDAVAVEHPDMMWLAATFLPEGIDEPVRLDEFETRYIAFVPGEGQLDVVPAAEAFALLRGAHPDGVHNALADVELQLLGYAVEGSIVTVDVGEGLAATRSFSSTQGRLAFNQFTGMLAHYFPEAGEAQVTVEGQPDPETFGGIDTTAPFSLRETQASGPRMEDIEAFPNFGFVHAVDASEFPPMVIFDDAEFVPGDTPTTWTSHNDTRGLSEYPMAGNVVIMIVEADSSEQVVTPQQWEERISAQARSEAAFYEPYHFTFAEGTVVEVRSQPMEREG